ncbi:MAG: hypothetical protein K5787_14475 [Lentisphaeria bacterium]|nr:hypothetical protein [Lentisphaeria bacterium]
MASICTGKKYEIATRVPYRLFVTDKTDADNAAVYVMLEYNADQIAPLLNTFVNDGIMPGGLVLFVNPGTLNATLPGGSNRNMRAEEFDEYGPEFINLIVEEMIPEAATLAQVKISSNPDMHFYTGGSSGGMSTWNALWFRNDFFRRGFLSSPTFSAMRGGEEPMVLVRKCETRPMRFYLSVGTREPDYFFGDSYNVAVNAKGAFDFAGYDFAFDMFVGEGHCACRADPTFLRKVMTFVWDKWQTEPVKAGKNQIRIQKLLAPGSHWELVNSIPEPRSAKAPNGGFYTFKGGQIILKQDGQEKVVANDLSNIKALAVSSDHWRLYVADSNRRFVYAYTIQPDGSLSAQYKLAPFHLAHDCRVIGALDLCVAADDRVFVATELGVQSIVSFGLNDVILPLPGDLPADKVRLEGNLLYAASGDKIFRRPLAIAAPADDDKPSAPKTAGYSDGFDYSRPHDMPNHP